MEIEFLWRRISPALNHSLAFSEDGLLGVSSFCRIINKDGRARRVHKIYNSESVSYCCGKFAFVHILYDGKIILVDKDTYLTKEIKLPKYTRAVGMSKEGMLLCSPSDCGFYDYKGKELWESRYGYMPSDRPVYYKGYWYVPTLCRFAIIKPWITVKEIKFPYCEGSLSADICGNYLAMSSYSRLYLYKLDDPLNPKLVKVIKGIAMPYSIAFSPDCKYIAVAENDRHMLRIYDIKGNLVFKRRICCIRSVAWWEDRLALGIENKAICMYRIDENAPYEGPRKEDPCSNLSPI